MSLSNMCLLCLRSSDSSMEILSRQGVELELEAILKEHFWFQVDELEEKSICKKCWRTVHDFHVLFTFVKLNRQHQIDFHIKSEIVDSNDYNELPVPLNTIKNEPNIDINKDSEYLSFNVSDTSCNGDVKETNDNLPKVTLAAKKCSRSSSLTGKVCKTDRHTALLSTYFTMSCDLCDALLPTYREVKWHYKNVHNIEGGYLICCSKKFYRLQAMLQHCQWHMNPDSFKCDFCQKTFGDNNKLRNHINLCHAPENEKVFSCNHCDKVFSRQHYLNAHVKYRYCLHSSTSARKTVRSPHLIFPKENEMIRNRFLMQCDLCGEPFAIFRDVKMHHAKVHNQAGYLYCCDRKFFKMFRAVQHCMWHDDPKSLKCSICQICFTDKIRLRDHIKTVHSPKAESCPKRCTMKVNNEKGVRETIENQQFECYACKQKFFILPLLKSHMNKVHGNIPSHVCEFCAKSFKSKQAFRLHYINVHTNILQKVQCKECGKWLKHEVSLKKHIRRHNSKTATCGICGRVCSNDDMLRAHIQRTHREPSLQCIICSKMFKAQNVLKEHMAIHTGVTDLYTCTFCTKTFRSKSNMYSHRKRAHPEQVEQMKASLNCARTPTATT